MEFNDPGFVLREINTREVSASAGILNIPECCTHCPLTVWPFAGGLKPVWNKNNSPLPNAALAWLRVGDLYRCRLLGLPAEELP